MSVSRCKMLEQSRMQIVCCILLCLAIRECWSIAKFTNMQCTALDANFTEFLECRMRAVKRNVNELSLRMKLLPKALKTNYYRMRWQLTKRASGYKPFLYDITLELCEYLEKRNHPFINIIFATFMNQTSGLTRCPLTADIELVNFGFPMKVLQTVPLPNGEYGLFATIGAKGKDRAIIKFYFALSDF